LDGKSKDAAVVSIGKKVCTLQKKRKTPFARGFVKTALGSEVKEEEKDIREAIVQN